MNDKSFIKYCNSLRCPLCNSQLDGKISKDGSSLYCVSNNLEYKCNIRDMEVIWEQICFWYDQYGYYFYNYKSDDKWITVINRVNLDDHPTKRKEELLFKFNAKIPKLFRLRIEEKDLLKKLKLYTVFS
jgi:hypothetical protein